jgi:hypothetical protein
MTDTAGDANPTNSDSNADEANKIGRRQVIKNKISNFLSFTKEKGGEIKASISEVKKGVVDQKNGLKTRLENIPVKKILYFVVGILIVSNVINVVLAVKILRLINSIDLIGN